MIYKVFISNYIYDKSIFKDRNRKSLFNTFINDNIENVEDGFNIYIYHPSNLVTYRKRGIRTK